MQQAATLRVAEALAGQRPVVTRYGGSQELPIRESCDLNPS